MSLYPSIDFEKKIGMPVGTISHKWILPRGISYPVLNKIAQKCVLKGSDKLLIQIYKELLFLNPELRSINCRNSHMAHCVYGVASRFNKHDIVSWVSGDDRYDMYELEDRLKHKLRIEFEWIPSSYTLKIIKSFLRNL